MPTTSPITDPPTAIPTSPTKTTPTTNNAASKSKRTKLQLAGISVMVILLSLSIPAYLPNLPYLNNLNLSPPNLVTLVTESLPSPSTYLPFLRNNTTTTILASPDQQQRQQHTDPTETEKEGEQEFKCNPFHTYKTQLVSLSPLIIYIHSLITPPEIQSLLAVAEPRFAPSQVTKSGRQQHTQDRTSSSAGLPRDDPTVQCVLNRTQDFLGTMLRSGWDEMGPPQLVRYTTGQRFNVHHDWFDSPRWANDDSFRKWNRVASFFAILQDNCTGGETYFPFAQPIAPPRPESASALPLDIDQEAEKPLWREHEDGGIAFRPVTGNAIFWINLHPNGTGDTRTNHAGLPLESGLKTAMNIWPRQYYEA